MENLPREGKESTSNIKSFKKYVVRFKIKDSGIILFQLK
jgi:hypothetical protein